MTCNRTEQRRQLAFTLVEILLVVVIIGILASVLVTSLSGRSQEARNSAAKSDIRSALSVALDLFEQDCGRYPTEEEGLKVLVENPGIEGWRGPYLKSGLKPDPWGTPYAYRVNPENPGTYGVVSAGPDKQFGTADDILP